MGATAMAKQKGPKKNVETPPTGGSEKGETVTIKGYPAQRDLLAKLAAMRQKSVADVLADEDVMEFLSHLLVAEMNAEAERLQGKRKP